MGKLYQAVGYTMDQIDGKVVAVIVHHGQARQTRMQAEIDGEELLLFSYVKFVQIQEIFVRDGEHENISKQS